MAFLFVTLTCSVTRTDLKLKAMEICPDNAASWCKGVRISAEGDFAQAEPVFIPEGTNQES